MSESKRYNEGKSRMDLLDPDFLLDMGYVQGFGAAKYDDDNWKLSAGTDKHDEFVRVCQGCMLRHTMAMMKGEVLDLESGFPHSAHVALNAMYIEYYNRRKA